MVKPIVRDIIFLAHKAEPATAADMAAALDLLDTLRAHREHCVGMAANMIGVNRRIIAVEIGGDHVLMFNPVILKSSGLYEAEEGCLSLSGTRRAKRFNSIKLQYQNEHFETRVRTFTGRSAQIIQHELDHCEGILI